MPRLLVLLACVLAPCAWLPAPSSAGPAPAASYEFHSSGPADQAWFFRFHLRDTGCVSLRMQVEPVAPSKDTFVVAAVFGTDPATLAALASGQPGPAQPVGPDAWLLWFLLARHADMPGESYVRLNATAHGFTVLTHEDVHEAPPRSAGSLRSLDVRVCPLLDQRLDGHYWAFLMTTQPVSSSMVRVKFHSINDLDADTPADAPGLLAMSSTTRAVARDQRVFEGVASASGDPTGATGVENALGLQLETTFRHERGFSGGILAWNGLSLASDAVLSYEGPDGRRGAGTMTHSPETPRLVNQVHGPAGDWTFRAHAYASAGQKSRLVAWGADLAIPEPPMP